VLRTIGYGPEVAAAFSRWEAADAAPGRVVGLAPGTLTVVAEDGLHRATPGGCLLSAMATDPAAAPCVGDWVVLRTWPDRRVTLEAVLPRRTCVKWPADGDRLLCANVDAVAVLAPARAADRGPARAVSDTLAAATPEVAVLLWAGTDADGLRERTDRGLTVALLGPEGRQKRALVRSLVGTRVLGGGEDGPALLALPGGGALVVLPALAHHGLERAPGA
jgi:ribosome biogenesis GTPase